MKWGICQKYIVLAITTAPAARQWDALPDQMERGICQHTVLARRGWE